MKRSFCHCCCQFQFQRCCDRLSMLCCRCWPPTTGLTRTATTVWLPMVFRQQGGRVNVCAGVRCVGLVVQGSPEVCRYPLDPERCWWLEIESLSKRLALTTAFSVSPAFRCPIALSRSMVFSRRIPLFKYDVKLEAVSEQTNASFYLWRLLTVYTKHFDVTLVMHK